MECGEGVPLCGVLTLETGRGGGAYRHASPVVHGLWPQVSRFGNSECLPPRDGAAPHRVYRCYDQAGESYGSNFGFERHEWAAHGRCAGAASAEDFFTQLCDLADGPLQVMAGARAAGMDLVDTVDALQRAGFCVWAHGSNQQVELSACAGHDGRWRLADSADFVRVCGPAASATASGGRVCVPNHHGPRCRADRDCLGLSGCARCARSGYCTDLPLPGRPAALLFAAGPGNATIGEGVSTAVAAAIAAASEEEEETAAVPVDAAAAAALLVGAAVSLCAAVCCFFPAGKQRSLAVAQLLRNPLARPSASPLGAPWLDEASSSPVVEVAPPALREV